MDTPRYTCCLLDLDGTLVDSIEDLTCAASHVCRAYGWPAWDAGSLARIVGNGARRLVADLVPADAAETARARGTYDELLGRALDLYSSFYAEHSGDHSRPFPGVPEALGRLRATGVRLGVLTNKEADAARVVVGSLYPETFDAVQGREDGVPPKPDPTGARRLMATLGADPARTLMIGDAEPDVRVGVAAGVDACGVLWGYRSREELAAAGATRFAADAAELERVVLGGLR